MGIDTILNNILNEPYIKNMRQSIVDGIEQVYEDATEKGDTNMEVARARGSESSLNDRLDKNDKTHRETTAQLAQKASINYVDAILMDIAKGGPNNGPSGPFMSIAALNSYDFPNGKDGTWLVFDNSFTDGAHSFMWDSTGSNWKDLGVYQAYGIPNYSIDLKKTTFSKVVSRNLFDRDAAFDGAVNGSTGALESLAGNKTTEPMGVPAGETIYFSANVSRYAFYDEHNVYISGEKPTTAIINVKVPLGAYYLRVTFYYTNLDTFMATVGPVPLLFDPYKRAVKSDFIEPYVIEDKSITPMQITAFESGKNLAHKDYLISGKYVSGENGYLLANAGYSVYDKVPVTPGTVYTWNFKSHIAFYDVNGKFISGLPDTAAVPAKVTFTTPTNCYYVSLSTKEADNAQLELGSFMTGFEKPTHYLKSSYLKQTDFESDVSINLPSTLYATVGEPFNVYTSNILKEKENLYNVNYDATFGQQTVEGFTATPTTAKNETLTVEIYNKSTLISKKTVSVVVNNNRITPIKVMLIGDSTVRTDTDGDGVGEGRVTQRMLDKLGVNVQLVGTKGISPNLHEGRSGWKVSDYRTDNLYEGVANPFYNSSTNDFDFSYYMNTQGFSELDVFIFNLGINDVFSAKSDDELELLITKILSDFEFISNSVKAYNPQIKVAFNLTIPPNHTQAIYGLAYGVGQTQWRYKYNNFELVHNLIDYFGEKNDLINTHSSIDTTKNIADGVHPNVNGYNQIGDTDVAYLNSL